MTDFIDHRFHLNGRRLHHLLPLGQVFERKPCGCHVPIGVDVPHDARCEARAVADALATQQGLLPASVAEEVRAQLVAYGTERRAAETAGVVVHSAQPMPAGWNELMDEVRTNMAEAGLIS